MAIGGLFMPLIQAVFYANPDRYPPIVNSARLLANAGFEMDLFCLATRESWNVSYPEPVRIHRIDLRSKNSKLRFLEFVARVLRRAVARPDIVLGEDMHGLLPARLLASIHGRPLVYRSHDLFDERAPSPAGVRAIDAFQKRLARTASLIVVADADRAQLMKQRLRLRAEPIVVANSPLRGRISSGDRLRRELRERGFGFEKIVLRQSNIGPSHAIEATIQSLPLWKNPSWGFVVMGPASDEYVMTIKTLARQLGVLDRFAVLPAVGYDQVAEFTPGANLGHSLYASVEPNNEFNATASNKLFEYMAAGVPLLASDRPALRRLVEAHRCGVVADESSPERIAQAVNSVLGFDEHERELGAAGRRAFEGAFCYELQFAPVLDQIRRLASGAGGRRNRGQRSEVRSQKSEVRGQSEPPAVGAGHGETGSRGDGEWGSKGRKAIAN
jgi:glycosyltransferase involved in cell wall biosynthesis